MPRLAKRTATGPPLMGAAILTATRPQRPKHPTGTRVLFWPGHLSSRGPSHNAPSIRLAPECCSGLGTYPREDQATAPKHPTGTRVLFWPSVARAEIRPAARPQTPIGSDLSYSSRRPRRNERTDSFTEGGIVVPSAMRETWGVLR
jgi:hypothetical protein